MSVQKEPFRIRDLRDKQRFYQDDILIDKYARFIGIASLGVYNSLSRHADREQSCYPSINLIADELAISKRTVIRGLDTLEAWNMVAIERIMGQNNVYYLIDRSAWKPIPTSIPDVTSDMSATGDTTAPGTSDITDTSSRGVTSDKNDTGPVTNGPLPPVPLGNPKGVYNPKGLKNRRGSAFSQNSSLKQKASHFLKGLEDRMFTDPTDLVTRLNGIGFEIFKIYCALEQARGKQSPAGYFINVLTSPKWSPSDEIMAKAKMWMNSDNGRRITDLTSELASKLEIPGKVVANVG